MDRDSLIKYIAAMIASGDAQTGAEDYDLEAIADDLQRHAAHGNVESIDPPTFWATVQKHRHRAKTSDNPHF